MLLFTEYVCLAILALSWSWSVLGWVAGFFITFGMGIITWCKSLSLWFMGPAECPDTSYILWKFCMKVCLSY